MNVAVDEIWIQQKYLIKYSPLFAHMHNKYMLFK